MTRGIRLILLACLFVLVFACWPALAQERILSYSSNITVNKDATMLVTETISVVCEQMQIKHGIYRDFPTSYRDQLGNNYVVDFSIQSITRDGAPEPYHTQGMPNGVRIYVGSADSYVSQGTHTYALTYSTNRQFGYFKDHDELYWNVTGNGWVFPIEQAQATITLPAGIAPSGIKVTGYTGPQGSTTQNLKAWVDSSGRPTFRTTSPLGSYEGLTIAASWPKGFIKEPSQADRLKYLLQDNRSILVCVLGLLATLAYFIWAQMKVGIDPAKGAIVPQWDPPDQMSPAALRYIRCMGSDNKALTAALINAAVKGSIALKEDKKVFTVSRVGEPKTPLTPEEQAAVDNLLHANEFIVLDQTYCHTVKAAIDAFKESLDGQFGNGYFSTHIGYALFGALLSIVTIVGAVMINPFGGKIPVVIAGVLLLVVNVIFFRLLRAFTRKGRALMDKAEGLRLYMRVAEQERLNVLDPPDRTPELFEKLLPYALALGVEHEWSEQFADVLAKAQAEGYHPSWYAGSGFYAGSYAGFASSVGSAFSSAISSSSTPPGSGGGGFGGGGSSGGGGGGGGGGGW